jgi:hypothetical protein
METFQSSDELVVLTAILAAFNLAFAAFHIYFWRWLGWPSSLQRAGSTNAAITQTLNLMLTYCFAVYGSYFAWAAFNSQQPSPLLSLAGAGFWLIRTLAQPALFGFGSRLSVLFGFIFALGTGLHLSAYFMR